MDEIPVQKEISSVQLPKSFLLIFFILIVFCVLIGFFVGRYQYLLFQKKEISAKTAANRELTPTPTPLPLNMVGGYFYKTQMALRQEDFSLPFLGTKSYPDFLKNIPDDQLAPMTCTYSFESSEKGYTYFNGKEVVPVPDAHKEYVRSLHDFLVYQTNFDPQRFLVCDYRLGSKTGGFDFIMPKHSAYTYIISDDNQFIFSKSQGGFGDCMNPLALTKNGELYIGCSGGENVGHRTIYKIDSTLKSSIPVYNCGYQMGSSSGPTCQ